MKALIGFQDINHQDFNGNSALHDASAGGHFEVVKVLTSRAVSINLKNTEGATPLYLAVEEDHFDIVKLLIQNGRIETCVTF